MTDLRKWSDEQLKATHTRLTSERDSAAATAQQMRKREAELRERAESDREARLEAQRTVDKAVTAEREKAQAHADARAAVYRAERDMGHARQSDARLDGGRIAESLRAALGDMKCGSRRGSVMADAELEDVVRSQAEAFRVAVHEHWSAREDAAAQRWKKAMGAMTATLDELTSAQLDVDAARERRDTLVAGAGSLTRDLRETVTEAELAEAKIRAADNSLRALDAEIQRRGSHAAKAS